MELEMIRCRHGVSPFGEQVTASSDQSPAHLPRHHSQRHTGLAEQHRPAFSHDPRDLRLVLLCGRVERVGRIPNRRVDPLDLETVLERDGEAV
jgi:hypothetical protein